MVVGVPIEDAVKGYGIHFCVGIHLRGMGLLLEPQFRNGIVHLRNIGGVEVIHAMALEPSEEEHRFRRLRALIGRGRRNMGRGGRRDVGASWGWNVRGGRGWDGARSGRGDRARRRRSRIKDGN